MQMMTATRFISTCANRSVCYLPSGTHEMNKALPVLPASLPLPLSKAWWAQAHGAECAQRDGTLSHNHSNFVRVATIRNPVSRAHSSRDCVSPR